MGSAVFLQARGVAMAWDRCVACLLLLLATLALGRQPGPEPGPRGLRYSYDCGVQGAQLRVYPSAGRTVRFKVMDEFGNQFEVDNCSICYHWVTAKPQGSTVFSAGYKGCHVLQKDGRSHLRVLIEAVLPDGRVDVARNATLVCPKPDHTWTPPASQPVPSSTFSLSTVDSQPMPSSTFSLSTVDSQPVPSSTFSLSTVDSQPVPSSTFSLSTVDSQPVPSSTFSLSTVDSQPMPSSTFSLSTVDSQLVPSRTLATPDSQPMPSSTFSLSTPDSQPMPSRTFSTPDSQPMPSSTFSLSIPDSQPMPSRTFSTPDSQPMPSRTLSSSDSQLVPSGTFSLSTSDAHSIPTTEHSICSTPASLSLGSGPTQPPRARPHGGVSENWGVDEPDYVGTHLTPEHCRGHSGNIPCVLKRSSKEACQQAGCCYDDTRDIPCYYGNTATVQCSRNGHLVLVVSQETALAHRITLASIRLAYAPTSCPPVQKTESFVVFHFPLTHCGTTVQMAGNQLIYENQLVSDISIQMGPQGSVTRDGTMRLQVRCVFNGSEFLPLQASVFPPPSPASVTEAGPLRLELRIAKDETFRSYYEERDYPIVKMLLEPVAVEVRLLQRTDPRLVLVLQQCWATPGANPFQWPQWPLLSDGCPFEGDNYRTRMAVALDRSERPFPAQYQRFTVATFTFLGSGSGTALRGPVYFFCSASACSPSSGLEACTTRCGPRPARQRRSSSRQRDTAEPQDVVGSPGPVGFVDSHGRRTTPGPSGSTGNSDLKRLPGVVLLAGGCCLVLGTAVFVGLSQARGLRGGSRG